DMHTKGDCRLCCFFYFSSRRRHTRCYRDWSSDVCSSDLPCGARATRRVFYSDDGSTAVEVALKMAYQYWQVRGGPDKSKKCFLRSEERRVGKGGRFRGEPKE